MIASANAATYLSFQQGDLRSGSNVGVGTNGTLISSAYVTGGTVLRSDAPTTPQPGIRLLVGNNPPATNRVLLSFDVSYLTNIVGTNAARIDSAALVLTHDITGAGSGSIHAVYLSSPFDEQTATWDQPAPGAPVGGAFLTPLRERSAIGTRTSPAVEMWGSPDEFWGADSGGGADLLASAVREALSNSTRTVWLMVRRKTELENAYYSTYVHDEDTRVNFRPELLVGVDSIDDTPLAITNYSILAFSDEFNQARLDTNVWAIATYDPSRTNVSVTNGMLELLTRWEGDRWREGLLETRNYLCKYGYYEARLRLNGAPGLNNAFWLNTINEIQVGANTFDRTEIDITEAHHEHNDSHMTLHDWAPTHVSPYSATFTVPNISADFHLVGLDWRSDNSLVFYWDGIARGFVSPTKFLGLNSMIPLAVLFSTKVISWAGTPDATLDGSRMLVDWIRVRQKPGWLGAVSGDWAQPANWGIDGVPGPGWNAVFNGPTPRPGVMLTTNIYCQSLYFDNANCPAFTLQSAASQLHLGAGPAGIGAITISSTVTNSQTIAVDVVADRPVQFGNFARGASPVLILNGGIDALSNDCSLQLCGFSPVQVNGALSSRIGRVSKWGYNRAWLAGTNAHSGPTDVVQGSLVVASPSALGQTGAGADTTVNSGSSLLFAPGTDYLLPETLHVSGSGRSGNGALDLDSNGVARFGGSVILDTNATLSCTPAGGTLRLTGEISGSGDILKTGTGTLELSASNSFTGAVRVRGGSLLVRQGRGLGAPEAATVIENTGRLQLGGGITLAEPLELQGALPGHLHLESLEGTNNVLAAVSLIGGGYDYGIAVQAGVLNLFGGIAFTDIYGTLRTLGLSGAGAGTISGPILDGASAPVALQVSGPCTWRLAGTNGYSGGTIVAGGTCLLTGTLRSEVVVSNGTFSGIGVISNRLVVAGGLHRPGSPVGTQSIRGNYTVSTPGALRFQLNAPGPAGQSALSVQNGSVTLSGSLQIDAPPSLATNTTFLVIDNDGTDPVLGTFSGLPEGATFFAAGYLWKVSYVGGTGNDVSLTVISRTRPTVSAVPSGPGLNLSWPEWAADYQLRAATNLSPPVFWSLVTNLITISNGTLSTLVPMEGPQRFFRLEFP